MLVVVLNVGVCVCLIRWLERKRQWKFSSGLSLWDAALHFQHLWPALILVGLSIVLDVLGRKHMGTQWQCQCQWPAASSSCVVVTC